MLLVLLLFSILVFFYYEVYWRKERQTSDPMIMTLEAFISPYQPYQIPPFQIKESKTHSYVDQDNVIHLVLRKPDGNYYDEATLRLILLHEITHIITHSSHHNQTFQDEYERLTKLTKMEGFKGDTEYPCN